MTDSLLAPGHAHRTAGPTNTWCSDRITWVFIVRWTRGGGGGACVHCSAKYEPCAFAACWRFCALSCSPMLKAAFSVHFCDFVALFYFACQSHECVWHIMFCPSEWMLSQCSFHFWLISAIRTMSVYPGPQTNWLVQKIQQTWVRGRWTQCVCVAQKLKRGGP